MAFGVGTAGTGLGAGIAIIVVIIFLLIALGIVFQVFKLKIEQRFMEVKLCTDMGCGYGGFAG